MAPRRATQIRDGHARRAEHNAGLVRVRPLQGEPDGKERAGDGRPARRGRAARARPAGGQHAPRVAARGRAEARGAARRDRAAGETGRDGAAVCGRGRVRGYECDHAVRRDAPRTERVVGRLGRAEETAQAAESEAEQVGGGVGGRGGRRGGGNVGISAALRVPARQIGQDFVHGRRGV